MTDTTIEFFWDAASPYTYLASTRIEALARRTGARLEWRPFLLGKVFEAAGNRMPASIPAKGQYMFEDLRLWARYYDVPFRFPGVFPMRSILALRVACAAGSRGADFARAVMSAYWTEDRDIARPEEIAKVCAGLGLDGAALLAQAEEAPAKERLRANTTEAVDRGAFGAPTFFVGRRMFWGNDRLPLLEACLKGELGG